MKRTAEKRALSEGMNWFKAEPTAYDVVKAVFDDPAYTPRTAMTCGVWAMVARVDERKAWHFPVVDVRQEGRDKIVLVCGQSGANAVKPITMIEMKSRFLDAKFNGSERIKGSVFLRVYGPEVRARDYDLGAVVRVDVVPHSRKLGNSGNVVIVFSGTDGLWRGIDAADQWKGPSGGLEAELRQFEQEFGMTHGVSAVPHRTMQQLRKVNSLIDKELEGYDGDKERGYREGMARKAARILGRCGAIDKKFAGPFGHAWKHYPTLRKLFPDAFKYAFGRRENFVV